MQSRNDVRLLPLVWADCLRSGRTNSAAAAPSQEQMMAALMKSAAVGPEHERLKAMAGKFDADVSAFEAPGGPAEKSKGVATNELILGGRYLKSDYAGTMGNMPFKGMGLFGYDNMKKKYITLWIDEMSTQMQLSEGTADASGKVITVSGAFDSPMDSAKHTMKQVWTIADNDHHTFKRPGTFRRTGRKRKCWRSITRGRKSETRLQNFARSTPARSIAIRRLCRLVERPEKEIIMFKKLLVLACLTLRQRDQRVSPEAKKIGIWCVRNRGVSRPAGSGDCPGDPMLKKLILCLCLVCSLRDQRLSCRSEDEQGSWREGSVG
jgi:hypothetical protein